MQVTYTQFAYQLGQFVRKTREMSVVFHEEFLAADSERQGEMRDQWILNHLRGQGYDKADKIMEMGRPGSAGKCRTHEQQQAYDKARGDFKYHVVRPTPKGNKAEPVKAPRISREERAAWAAFVATVGAERAAVVAKTLG